MGDYINLPCIACYMGKTMSGKTVNATFTLKDLALRGKVHFVGCVSTTFHNNWQCIPQKYKCGPNEALQFIKKMIRFQMRNWKRGIKNLQGLLIIDDCLGELSGFNNKKWTTVVTTLRQY